MYCNACGSRQPDDAQFCSNCGAALNHADVSQQPSVVGAPSATAQTAPAQENPGASPVAQQPAPSAAQAAAASAEPKKSWLENRAARIGLLVLGILLVVVGIGRIATGLRGSDTTDTTSSQSAPAQQTRMQTFGSPKVGYVQVPESWVDRTAEDVDEHNQDDYGMMLIVNPDTEYVSAVQEHYAFGQAIQMTVQPTSYKEIAASILESYQANPDLFGQADQVETTIGGRDAIFIATSVPDDNLQIGTFVIDRDGNDMVAVALALNCGASDAQADEVLSYASTWHYE